MICVTNMGKLQGYLDYSNKQKENVIDYRLKICSDTVRKPFRDKGNLIPKPDIIKQYDQFNVLTVQMEYLRADQLIKSSNMCLPYICLERLSTEDLSKHLKECNVVTSDILDSNFYNKEKVNINNKMRKEQTIQTVPEVDVPRRFSLRKRRNKINYADMNRGSSILNEKSRIHVPIYEQKTIEKKKMPADVYEFDSDSEKKKNKKRKSTLDGSIPFDKEMKVIMHNIENKNKKLVKKKRRANIKTKEIKNTKNTIIKTNINRRSNIELNKRSENGRHNKKTALKDVATLKDDSPVIAINNNSAACTYYNRNIHHDNDDDGLDLSDIDMAPLELEICTVEKLTRINIAHKVPDFRLNILQNIELSKFMESDLNPKYQAKDSDYHNLPQSNISTAENESGNTLSMNSKNDDAFLNSLDLFDSDTLNSPRGNSTPWRLDFQTKRNPFFLQFKQTSLPSYNQEMVIDSTIEQAVSGNKTPRNYNPSRAKQSSILSYLNGTSISNSVDVTDSSLYDIHELSPIKLLTKTSRDVSKSPCEKENQPLNSTLAKELDTSTVKRRVLGERTDNSLNISNSPIKVFGNTLNSNEEKEMTFFGFNNSVTNAENEKELQKPKKKAAWLFGKPIRLDDYLVIDTTAKNRAINKNAEKQVNEVTEQVAIDLNQQDETQQIDEGGTAMEQEELGAIRLFEDLEPANKDNMTKTYERVHKRRRRRNQAIPESEDSEDELPHSRKRKKDKRTKEEEKEAEKWAKAFNKMCKEVDEFPLEIQ